MSVSRPCPVCNAGRDRHFYAYRRYGLSMRVVICTGCGLLRSEPMPNEEELVAARGSLDRLHRPAYSRSDCENRARRYLRGLGAHARPGARLLDVGCGDGSFLALASASGLKCTGVDIAPWDGLRDVLGPDVRVLEGGIESVQPDGERFDLVTASHVIEHVCEPASFLRAAAGLLAPGGVLQLEAPNTLRPKTSFQRWFCPQHHYYFCPDTLVALLARNGFRPLSVTCFVRDSFQVLATPGECQDERLKRGADWRAVAAAVRRHRWAYKASGQFAWRKLPWVRSAMYRVAWRRELGQL